jgi:hypothetical protein
MTKALPTLLFEIVPVPSLMWWCLLNRSEAADVIKQGHETIKIVTDVGNLGTSVPTSEGGGAFVDAPRDVLEKFEYLPVEKKLSMSCLFVVSKTRGSQIVNKQMCHLHVSS